MRLSVSEETVSRVTELEAEVKRLRAEMQDREKRLERVIQEQRDTIAGNQEAYTILQAEAAAMREALGGVLALIADSQGVAGYHLNGTIASWSELGYPEELEAVLSTNAGAKLLARLQAAEQVVERAQELDSKLGLMMGSQPWDKEWLDLHKALAAWEEAKSC